MRKAFSLIELVVVVLVLGILASIAVPKFLSTSDVATDKSVQQSLIVVRDAIELFMTQQKRLPGDDGNAATFKADLANYIRKFPVLPVGPAQARNDEVVMDASTGMPAGDGSPSQGWRYYFKTGAFIVNSNSNLKSDTTAKYDEL